VDTTWIAKKFESLVNSLERMFSTQTSPNLSLTFQMIIKLRVLTEFFVSSASSPLVRRRLLRLTKATKGIKSSSTAIVLANGKSLDTLNLEALQKEKKEGNLEIFAVNYLPLSNLGERLALDYLVLSDPLTRPDSNNLKSKRLWQFIGAHRDLTLIVPTSWWRAVQGEKNSNPVLYFDDRSLEGWTKNISPTKPRGYITLTAYKALAFAIYLGYRKIKILGFDNNTFLTLAVDQDNNLWQRPLHVSGAEGSLDKKQDLSWRGVGDYFYSASRTFIDLYVLFKGKAEVVNLDPTSLTDAFPKCREDEPLVRPAEESS